MYVYFIQDGRGNGGPIKIGKAKDVEKRLSILQIGNPRKLTLLAAIKCKSCGDAIRLEKELHKKFSNYQLRGEWFRGSIELHTIKEAKFDVEPPEEIVIHNETEGKLYRGRDKLDPIIRKKYNKIKKVIWQKMGKFKPSNQETARYLTELTGVNVKNTTHMKRLAVKYCEENGFI